METGKRQVTIIDELWDNEDSNFVGKKDLLFEVNYFLFFLSN